MQTLTPLLMFWRRSAPAAVIWGFLFTMSSMLLLQLNYLGAFEFLLWFVLFHRPRQHSGTPVVGPRAVARGDKALHGFLVVWLTLFVLTDVATSTDLVNWRDLRATSALRTTVGLHAPTSSTTTTSPSETTGL
jgi:cytochrome c oxidase subunit IV